MVSDRDIEAATKNPSSRGAHPHSTAGNYNRSPAAHPYAYSYSSMASASPFSPARTTSLRHRSDRSSGSFSTSLTALSAGGVGASPSVFLATRLDHPIFDFEDWHSTDKQNQDAVYSLFMKAHKCYDLIPNSSKLVVFDTELPVSKAFYALVYNGVRAAPLWDSSEQQFVGMLTITDFIQILHKYYKCDSNGDAGGQMTRASMEGGIRKLEEHKISTWRNILKKDKALKPMVVVDPSESLYRAVEILCEHQVHRLPVLEQSTGNILYILTHKRLIKFLYLYLNDLPKPPFMDQSPKELGIGAWEDICTINKDTPLIEAMRIFLTKRVSALPVIDNEGHVVDIYAKFDAINLAADKTYNNLDVTVYEALQHRSEWFEGVRKCSIDDSLWSVIQAIVKWTVHRLVVTDNDQRVVGIVSLSDILRYLVLHPSSEQLVDAAVNHECANEGTVMGGVQSIRLDGNQSEQRTET